jgi:hypothetical protein
MVLRAGVCLRRLGAGRRCDEVRFGRFVANAKVTVESLIEGWSEQTASAARGRHVLAIQDTSEINFTTRAGHRRGLGKTAKGHGHGVLLHAMLGLDADSGVCLGLVGGAVWTRRGPVSRAHASRALAEKESQRWVSTAQRAKQVLSQAAAVTVVADRESDIYAEWASVPGAGLHLLTRVMHDRALTGGASLYQTGAGWPQADSRTILLPARGPNRPERQARLSLRFGQVELRRPRNGKHGDVAAQVALRLIEVVEAEPPQGCEPVHWRLLTTHEVADAAKAWQIVDWYKARWAIEQLFRLMKSQGLKIEDSQIESAERLVKLVAIAAKAAAMTMQLLHARDGKDNQPASLAFNSDEIDLLDTIDADLEGKTQLQKNPHPQRSLAWAAWIIARLGGWDGYPSSKRPGPITMRNGLDYFRSLATGWTWARRNVCMP